MSFRVKKGELTSEQIVIWVIVIASFIIIIAFIAGLNLTGMTDEEQCKLSVVSRATMPLDVAKSFIPLNCNTKKICITSGKGNCGDVFGGESPQIISLPGDPKAAIKLIEKTSADEMYSCWNVMGKGKLDLFNNAKAKFGVNSAKRVCVMCSRIAIDPSVNASLLEQVDINTYMQLNQISSNSEQTYLQAMTDNQFNAYAKSINDFKYREELNTTSSGQTAIGTTSKEKVTLNGQTEIINRQMAFIFTQIKSPSVSTVLANQFETAAAVGAGFALAPGKGLVTKTAGWALQLVAGKYIKIVKVAVAVAAVAGAATVAGYGVYNSRQGQLIAASYCGNFTSNEQVKTGCSIVQGVNYDVPDINSFCDYFDGNL